MKFKFALQVVTVCSSVALLGAYVVYAHRQAQPAPSAISSSRESPVAANSASLDQPFPSGSGGAQQFPQPGPSTASSSSQTLAPSSKLMINVIPKPAFRHSPTPPPSEEEVVNELPPAESTNRHSDGSSVTTRVVQNNAPTFAPSSKVIILPVFTNRPPKTTEATPSEPVQIVGQTLKPGTFRTSEQPKLIGVIPPPEATSTAAAPKTSLPTPTAQTTRTVPRETIIFSTKSAPVFVAPRSPSATAAVLEAGVPKPTPPRAEAANTGTPTTGAPAAIPPPQPSRAPVPNASAPKADSAPTQQLQQRAEPAQTTVTPKPRLLAPGSKSVDLRFFAPHPTSPTPSPTQFPVQPAPEKPRP